MESWQQDIILVEGHEITDTDTAFNLFNICPVLSVPAGITDRGLPAGIQVVGRPYADATTFHVGPATRL